MESLLDEIAERGLVDKRYHRLLDALKPDGPGQSPRLTLPELLAAKNDGRLGGLIEQIQDPPLDQAIAEFAQTTNYRRTHDGLRLLQELLASRSGLTLGYLRNAKHVVDLCHAAMRPTPELLQGRKRNSVRRSLLVAISGLLQYHLGKAQRDLIFSDVSFPEENDTRDVFLSPTEIERLLLCCEEAGRVLARTQGRGAYIPPVIFPAMVRLALVTGADRGVLLRLQKKDFQIIYDPAGEVFTGSVYLADTKTKARPRTVDLSDATCRLLIPLLEDLDPAERIFDMTEAQVKHRWYYARKKAGFPNLRFKDLRHLFGIYGDRAGLTISQLAAAMGHVKRATTLRYAVHSTSFSSEAATAVERAMGLAAKRDLGLRLASGDSG